MRRRKKSSSNNSSASKRVEDVVFNFKHNSEETTNDNENNNEEGITSGDKEDNNSHIDKSRSYECLSDALNNVSIEDDNASDSELEDHLTPDNNENEVNNLEMQMLSRRAEEETALNRGDNTLYPFYVFFYLY